jgi:predicted Ser/Thr protein kinase
MPYCPTCKQTFPGGHFCPTDGVRLLPDKDKEEEEERDPLLGQIIADRFRIVSKLGVGGMGAVYEAEHRYIQKRVALKLLRPEITSNPDALARFQREALAASTIGHENIVAIDDFGRLPDGQVYLTMEYLDGEPLNRAMRRAQLPVDQMIDVLLQTCHGLAAAHAKGIIHRDMKPENIFLVEGGRKVKILDFGIAKVTRGPSDTNLTKTGAIFGTPNYMAPEQALGKRVDHRVDVYSMGIILFEMLAGTVPFRSDSFVAILTQHVTKDPVPPSKLAPGRTVPLELERVALRAIAKSPNERFQDMGEFVAALLATREKVLGDVPLEPRLRLSKIKPPASEAPTSSDLPAVATGPGGVVDGEGGPGKVTATAGELVQAMRPARRRTGLIIGLTAAVLLGAGGVVAFVHLRGPGPARPPLVVQRPAKAPASAPVGDEPKQEPEQKAEAPVAPPHKEVRVLVTSVPPEATILVGGKVVGKTPESFSVPAGEQLVLVLRRAGYREQKVVVKPDAEQDKVVRQVRLVSTRRKRVRRGRKVVPRLRSDHGDHDTGQMSGDSHGSSHDDGH